MGAPVFVGNRPKAIILPGMYHQQRVAKASEILESAILASGAIRGAYRQATGAEVGYGKLPGLGCQRRPMDHAQAINEDGCMEHHDS